MSELYHFIPPETCCCHSYSESLDVVTSFGSVLMSEMRCTPSSSWTWGRASGSTPPSKVVPGSTGTGLQTAHLFRFGSDDPLPTGSLEPSSKRSSNGAQVHTRSGQLGVVLTAMTCGRDHQGHLETSSSHPDLELLVRPGSSG